jgi:hypothetical protein
MMYQNPMQRPTVTSAAPRPLATPPVQQQGYNGAVGQGLQPVVQALMQAKMRQRLAGQNPGTTGQAPGPTPAMPAAASPGFFSPPGPSPQQPLSLGGTPPGVPGAPPQ